MSTVSSLIPGDRVVMGAESATFVQHAQHPLWPHLRLVVWKMPDDSWSHDCLDARQDVGEAMPATDEDRKKALRRALLHPSQW